MYSNVYTTMSIQQCLCVFQWPSGFWGSTEAASNLNNKKPFLLLWWTSKWQKLSICKWDFFCHLRGQIQSKLFYRLLVTYKLQVHIFAPSNDKRLNTRSNGKKFQICKWKYFAISTFIITEKMPLAKTWPVISHSLKIWTYERLYTLWEETD